MKRLLLIVLGWLVMSFTLHAASFDCDKAQTKIEKLICADEKLSKLDEAMRAAYREVYGRTADPAGLKNAQRKWLKTRDACRDVPCLERAHKIRLSELEQAKAEPKPCFRLLERAWPQVQSGHYPVCLDYLKNLNSFCNEPPPTCERKLDPAIKSLALPQWEEIDPKAHLEVIGQMLTPNYYYTQIWIPLSLEMKTRILAGKTRLWHAWIDLDHDGKVEHVIRFEDGRCKPAKLPSGQGFGFNYDMAVVDDLITQVDTHFDYLGVGEVLLHDGRAYVLKDESGGGIEFTLRAPFRISVTGTRNAESVCIFNFLK